MVVSPFYFPINRRCSALILSICANWQPLKCCLTVVGNWVMKNKPIHQEEEEEKKERRAGGRAQGCLTGRVTERPEGEMSRLKWQALSEHRQGSSIWRQELHVRARMGGNFLCCIVLTVIISVAIYGIFESFSNIFFPCSTWGGGG